MSQKLSDSQSSKKYPTETVDQAIYTAIREYLMHKKLYETLQVFESERNVKKQQPDFNKLTEIQIKDILQFLVNGNFDKQFKQLHTQIPREVIEKDPLYLKIEFFSQIQFAAINQHHNLNNQNLQIQKFKEQLDTRGQDFSSNNEQLPQFALPYASQPIYHPIFKRFFENKWKEEFSKKVEAFLYQAITTKQSHPALVKMAQAWILFHKNKKDADVKQKMIGLLEQKEELINEYKKLKKSQDKSIKREGWLKNKQKEDTDKWSKVSRELLNLSSTICNRMMSQGGQPSVAKEFLEKIQNYNQYINLMNSDSAYASESFVFLEDNNIMSINNNHNSKNNDQQDQNLQYDNNNQYDQNSIQSPEQYQNSQLETTDDMLAGKKFMELRKRYNDKLTPLNCDSLKKVLVSKSEKISTICSILQGLAWRLEQTSRINSREQLVDLVQSDILGVEEFTIANKNNAQELNESLGPIIDSLVNKFGLKVKQYTIRLINAMASDSVGRSYLLQNDNIIYLLYQILKNESTETLLRQDALGALQKFSLRREPQDIMIQLDVIKQLVQLIKKEQFIMSDYSLEYSTALLMNMSLRTKGKDKCSQDTDVILDLLISMLDHKNEYVRTYINGILQSILSREQIKKHAIKMNLDRILDELIENTEERFYRQYTYIKTQLLESEKQEAKSEVDDEDIEEFLEDEENEDDDVGIEDEDLTQFGVETGEDILRHFQDMRQYKESFIDRSMNRSVLEKKDTDSIFRPTTPSIKNSFVQRRPTPFNDESSSFIKQDGMNKFKQPNQDDSISMAYESRHDISNSNFTNPSTDKNNKYINYQQQQQENDNDNDYENENENENQNENGQVEQNNKSILEELENNDE